jgi:hypothetical protein
MDFPIRKTVVFVEETFRELDRDLDPLQRRAVAVAVVGNALAGRYAEDLTALAELGGRLGRELAERALAALGIPAGKVQSYGKAAIVGTAGEIEHGAAILHPRFGKQVRAFLAGATEIMPSAVKRAGAGATLDVPLHNLKDMWSFDHFDAVPVSVADAPAPDEILVALALADHGRPLARVTTNT